MRRQILKQRPLLIIALMVLFVSSGCVVRSYTVIKERPDQEVTGNQGYLLGEPPRREEKEIKIRKTYVFEVELGKTASVEKKASE
ncbi:MAG: hypothetical protein ISS45_03250 [Candidatus Omnitrophica bacterium]|nr:hypothetical protein [Candidatus Omnitrophota bacterium]